MDPPFSTLARKLMGVKGENLGGDLVDLPGVLLDLTVIFVLVCGVLLAGACAIFLVVTLLTLLFGH